MGMKRLFVCSAMVSMLALPVLALSAEKAHEGMTVTKMEGQAGMPMKSGGHDMMQMGDKLFSGKIGPWVGTARIIDMKAHLEASGMKAQGAMMNSHHIALALTDPKTKKPVTEGTGTVTVVGPDKSETTYNVTGMQGHFGADINMPIPGKYTCHVRLESGGKTGTLTFHYTLK